MTISLEVFLGFAIGFEFTKKEWLDDFYRGGGWYLVLDLSVFRLIFEGGD